MMPKAAILIGAMLWTSACSAATPTEQSGDGHTENRIGTEDATPEASPAAAPALSAYVGKYPWDKVDGVDFLHHPAVVAAVRRSVSDPEIRDSLLVETAKSTAGPIIESEGRLLMSAFEPASGGDVNWSILMALDGDAAAVCWSTGVIEYSQGADWYHDGEKRFTLYSRCSYDAESLAPLGTWPIGPIPG
ncbi:MAG: hypothetical protein U0S50_12245 [Sphingopyxis sp.]|uniref:hypothetical protein n=1 Tax=Sphingopyxis sp. TaxID=1908224 RepID=UPI002ABC6A5B|nr:hypothetical protein [Sphingopyxis sp.]MDZ3832566.1 hypothetical protein [Sphingopyxis sp.]